MLELYMSQIYKQIFKSQLQVYKRCIFVANLWSSPSWAEVAVFWLFPTTYHPIPTIKHQHPPPPTPRCLNQTKFARYYFLLQPQHNLNLKCCWVCHDCTLRSTPHQPQKPFVGNISALRLTAFKVWFPKGDLGT